MAPRKPPRPDRGPTVLLLGLALLGAGAALAIVLPARDGDRRALAATPRPRPEDASPWAVRLALPPEGEVAPAVPTPVPAQRPDGPEEADGAGAPPAADGSATGE